MNQNVLTLESFGSCVGALFVKAGVNRLPIEEEKFHQKFYQSFQSILKRLENVCNLHVIIHLHPIWGTSDNIAHMFYNLTSSEWAYRKCPSDGYIYFKMSPMVVHYILDDYPKEVVALLEEMVKTCIRKMGEGKRIR